MEGKAGTSSDLRSLTATHPCQLLEHGSEWASMERELETRLRAWMEGRAESRWLEKCQWELAQPHPETTQLESVRGRLEILRLQALKNGFPRS